MRLGLTYDLQTNPQDERQAEWDPPQTLEALTAALQALGHDVRLLGNAFDLLRDPARLDGVELMFNIAEGSHGRCREAWVPILLELWGVPYVGSDALALALGLDKVACKRLAVADGVRTPRWIALEHPARLPDPLPLSFPVIVKPRAQGSGIGIDAGAVVRDQAALARRAQVLFQRWPEPLLVEEFVADGELTVLLIGNDPPAAYPVVQRPLDPATRLSYHVVHRTTEGSWEAPLVLTPELEAEAQRVAMVMCDAIGCRDVARVDLRVDGAGRVYFLEINPSPSFDPDGTVGLLAQQMGVTYQTLIGRIVDAALRRLARPRAMRA